MFLSGVTAMLWVPPTGSVTSAVASVSASLASPVSTASAARSTTSGLDVKAANPVTVTLRGLFHSSAKTMVAVNAEKALWEIAVTNAKRTISTIGLGPAAKNAPRVTGW